jgi:hypothetical protein
VRRNIWGLNELDFVKWHYKIKKSHWHTWHVQHALKYLKKNDRIRGESKYRTCHHSNRFHYKKEETISGTDILHYGLWLYVAMVTVTIVIKINWSETCLTIICLFVLLFKIIMPSNIKFGRKQ